MATLPRPQSRTAGSRNLQIDDALALGQLRPDCRLECLPDLTTKVRILPGQTGSGDLLLRVPWREVDADRNAGGFRSVKVPAGWVVDLAQAGIDLPGKVGGRIDGTAAGAPNVTANTDYRVWALIDPAAPDGDLFKGFGATASPTATGVTVSGTIVPGASGLITTASAPAFTIGARVLMRVGTAVGSAWNQATITGMPSSTTLTLQADASWGAANENNGNLTGGGWTLIQLDRFEPRIITGSDLGSNWPGDNSWAWAYLGMIQTGSTKLTRMVRQWGDWYVSIAQFTTLSVTAGIAPPATWALGRYLPWGSLRAQWTVNDQTGGIGYLTFGIDAVVEARVPVSSDARGGGWALATLQRGGLVTIARTTIALNPLYTVFLNGWQPPVPW